MQEAQGGSDYFAEVTFSPGLSTAFMKVVDITAGLPGTVIATTLMDESLPGTYVAMFVPAVGKFYLLQKAVYTDSGASTLDTDYNPSSETVAGVDSGGGGGGSAPVCNELVGQITDDPRLYGTIEQDVPLEGAVQEDC